MLKKIVLGLVALLALFLIVPQFTQPNEFRISRGINISASSADVFPWINDLHKSNEWSPFLESDPNAKLTYGGAPAGVGASYSWNGNQEMGEGKMTITESRPTGLVRAKLEFKRPMEDVAETEWKIEDLEGGGSSVTWSMFGKHTPISKVMCLFMNMDKMLGGTFEKGLASLKTKAESSKR